MTVRPSLPVYLRDRHVANVLDAGFGDTAIEYTNEALADPPRSRLSLSLPVRSDIHPTYGAGGAWVRSLLPEGRALAWAVTHFGIPENDRFGLIEVLGGDVASAAQVLAHGEVPADRGRYLPASAEELADVVGRAHDMGLGLDRARGVRLSLAGMQDKVLLHRTDDGYAFPIDGAASTLIVKPEPAPGASPRFEGLVTNELFCTRLARECDLDAVTSWIEAFGDTQALVIERYDRMSVADGPVLRLHQEDLLSALGTDPLLKYERPMAERTAPGGGFELGPVFSQRGGPSLADLAAVLARHIGIARLGSFLEAVAFNLVIGNADAHARNYSVLLEERGTVRLAPLYDLVCTRMWNDLDAGCAQLVAGREDIDEVRAEDLVEEATSWGVARGFAATRVDRLLDRIQQRIDDAAQKAVRSGGDADVVDELVRLIRARAERFRLD